MTLTLRGDAARRVELERRRRRTQSAKSSGAQRTRSVVVFAPTKEIAHVLTGAAEAEGLEVVIADDLRSAYDAVVHHEPGVVLAEAVEDYVVSIVAAIVT